MIETEQGFILRPAVAGDQLAIWRMVLGAGLNPLHLWWENFILAVSDGGEILGCGQIKSHKDGSRELASIYVIPAVRGQGLARAIIERLLSEHQSPIWLTCRRELAEFYQRFGFIEAHEPDCMPAYFRQVKKLINVLSLTRDGGSLAVMCWRAE
jgi:GNAT superfamily N-acetyltransferase